MKRSLLQGRYWNHVSSIKTLLHTLDADIICFQETKLTRISADLDICQVDGYEAYFSFSKTRQGYSGVATYVRKEAALPLAAEEGFSGILNEGQSTLGGYDLLFQEYSKQELNELDSEGRCIITDHGGFILFNV